jgi:hypothetical protein
VHWPHTAPAPAGGDRGQPADLSLVIAIALTLYVGLAASVLILSPLSARWFLAVTLGAGAGVVTNSVRTAYRSGRLTYGPEEPEMRSFRLQGRRPRWRVVEAVPFADIQIDEVAVGPHGVIAVETAYVPWPGPITEGDLDSLDDARRRARRGARRIRLILKSQGIDTTVEPAVAMWGSGSAFADPIEVGDVTILVGRHQGTWRGQLPKTGGGLSQTEIVRIERALRSHIHDHRRAMHLLRTITV